MSVEARFRLQRGEFVLDAELSLPGRGVTALFGRSGAGKTTLLRAIAGLEPASEAYLEVDGEVWQHRGEGLAVHRRALAFVFQEPSLFAHLSVRGNLEYGYRRLAARERRLEPVDVIDWLELEPLLGRPVERLSGGEKQRVSLGRALLASPRLLLMDEPLAALDRQSRAAILPCLDRLQRELEIPVLYVGHSLDDVARLAGRVAWMRDGRILAVGPTAEILTRLDLPLAARRDAEALLEARVVAWDAEDELTELAFTGGRLTIPGRVSRLDAEVRVRILARDVSLTLERQRGTSILNILEAEVRELADAGPAQKMVRLDVSGATLLSLVTRKSATALELAPGRRLWAQIKSVAVLD